jgi:hypothetical protein
MTLTEEIASLSRDLSNRNQRLATVEALLTRASQTIGKHIELEKVK